MFNKLKKVATNKWYKFVLPAMLAVVTLFTLVSPALACDIHLSKSGPKIAHAGEQINYDLTWSTVGDNNFINNNLILVDSLPQAVTYVSSDNGGVYDSDTHTVTWKLGVKTANVSGLVKVVVTIDSNIGNGEKVTNHATLYSTAYKAHDAKWKTEIVEGVAPIITLEKTGPVTAVPGQNITYELKWAVTNAKVTNLILTDAVPAGTIFVSADHSGIESGGVITWNLGKKNADDSGTVTLVVNVKSALTAPDTIINTAELNSDETDGVQDSVITKIKTDDDNYYDVTITKTADKDVVNVGDTLTYTLNWEVTGNGTIAPHVIVGDLLPAETTFISAEVTPDLIRTSLLTSGRTAVAWYLGDLAVGTTGSFDIVVKVNSQPANDTIDNLGGIGSGCSIPTIDYTLTSSYTNDDWINIGTAACARSDFDILKTKVGITPFFNLNIEKHAPNFANPGDDIIYTINWEVTGNTIATDVKIFDYLPEGTVVKSTNPNYDNVLTVMGTKYQVQTVVWNLGDVTPNAIGTIELIATANTGLSDNTVLENTVKMISGQKSAQDKATTTITDQPYYNLNITKTADQNSVYVGDTLTYTINWGVTGNIDAPNVSITDTLPIEATFVSATGNYATTTNGLVWQLGDITPNATGTIEVVVTIDSLSQTGLVTNSVAMTSGQKSAQDDVTTTVVTQGENYFALGIVKSAETQVEPGQNINYEIDWSVTGNKIAQNVVVIDTLPSNVNFVSASGTYVYNTTTNEIIWNLGDITPGKIGTFALVVSTTGLVNGNIVTNNIVMDSMEQTVTDNAITSIYKGGGGGGGAYHKVNIEKLGPAKINVGEDINYTINWSTRGTETAPDVIITDVLPANTIFYSATGNYNYATSTHILTWKLGDVWPANSGSFEVVLKTDTNLLNNGDILTNKVDIRSGVETNTASVKTTVYNGGGVMPNPSVQLKYAYPLQKIVSGTYTEVVTVINTGDVILTNGILSVDLPENFINFVASANSNYTIDTAKKTLNWAIPTLTVGAQKIYTFDIQALVAGLQVKTDVTYDSDQADTSMVGIENIIVGVPPAPLTVPPISIVPPIVVTSLATTTPVVAGEAVGPAAEICAIETCSVVTTPDVCENCQWWVWAIIILLHILIVLVYWFYASKEEIKEKDEYYIIKGNWAWVLPVLLALTIIFLLLVLVCTFTPYWVMLAILIAYFLALVSHMALIRKAELKYSPLLPLLVTIIVLAAYLFHTNWSWWIWVIVLLLYALTLVAHYTVIVKMDTKSRKYWWIVIPIMTFLAIVIEIIVKSYQCL